MGFSIPIPVFAGSILLAFPNSHTLSPTLRIRCWR